MQDPIQYRLPGPCFYATVDEEYSRCRMSPAYCQTRRDSVNYVVYVNGVRYNYHELLCDRVGDSREETYARGAYFQGNVRMTKIESPAARRALAWTIRREINRYVYGKPNAAPTTSIMLAEEPLIHGQMYKPFVDAMNLDPLRAYHKTMEHDGVFGHVNKSTGQWEYVESHVVEPVAYHRLATAALIYAYLFYSGSGNQMLEYIQTGNNAWIEFVIQNGYTQIMPQLLDLDPIYTSPDPAANLNAELAAWQAWKGTDPGTLAAPPKGFPTPVGWVPNIWPVVNAVTGALVTIPGLPPPCRPFPQCVLQKVPGLSSTQMWDMIKLFVAKTPGVNLILDENGLRFVPPKSLPKPPTPKMQGIIKTALEEQNLDDEKSGDSVSGVAVAGIAGAGVLAAALLAIALSDD